MKLFVKERKVMLDTRNIISKKISSLKVYYLWHYASRKLDLTLVSEYPKSGGTWLCQMLSEYLAIPFPRISTPKFEKSLLHGHYLYSPSFNRIVYQIRDGRDVIVSLYNHMYFGTSILSDFAMNIYKRKAPFNDFDNIHENLPVFIEYLFTKFTISGKQANWSDFMQSYLNRPNVIYAKYENLLQHTEEELKRIIIALEGENHILNEKKIKQVVEKYSFKSLSQRKRGEENKSHFLRKGIAGDWKNYFSREASQVFNHYAGKELILLGYEKNENWF